MQLLSNNSAPIQTGLCPFFNRCPARFEFGPNHDHTIFPRGMVFTDNLPQTQEFDFIAHYYQQADMTAVWNRFRLKPAIIQRVLNQ